MCLLSKCYVYMSFCICIVKKKKKQKKKRKTKKKKKKKIYYPHLGLPNLPRIVMFTYALPYVLSSVFRCTLIINAAIFFILHNIKCFITIYVYVYVIWYYVT